MTSDPREIANPRRPPRRTLFAFALTLVVLMFARPAAPAQTNSPGLPDNAFAAAPKHSPNTGTWKKNRDAGEKALKQNDAITAEPLLKAALAEAENFDPHDYRLAESLEDLGILYGGTGRDAEAEPLLRQAADIRRGDPKASMEGESFLNLGIVCCELGKYSEAEADFQHAQQAIERSYGADNHLAIICIFYRGKLYCTEGKFSQAEPLLKQCLPRFENDDHVYKIGPGGFQLLRMTIRPNYYLTLETLGCLSQICYAENRPAEAEKYLEDSLTVTGQATDRGSQAFQASLENLVGFYLSQSDYPQAEALLKHTIRLQQKSPGSNHPYTLRSQALLAHVYDCDQKLPDAEALYQKTITTQEKAIGPESDEVVETLMGLAKFYLAHGRWTDAEPLYRRLLVRGEKYQGDGVALTPILSDQAIVYAQLGRDAELEAVYKHQIAIYENMFGRSSKAVVKPIQNYALLLRKENRDTEAAPLEARANAIEQGYNK